MFMLKRETILIIDFGSQYTQLITRRIREANVYSEIHPHTITLEKVKEIDPAGIIFSGGPMSVYDNNSPDIDPGIINLKIPLLGICYGLQLICKILNGKVDPAKDREYGRARLILNNDSILFSSVKRESNVWMSHGDYLTELPEGFKIIAKSDHSPICAISNENKKIYGVQDRKSVV